MSLFKYCHPDRVDVLESAMIRFTPPYLFNDPFEMKPHVSALISEGRASELYRENARRDVMDRYDQLITHKNADQTDEQFIAYLVEKLFLNADTEMIAKRHLADLDLEKIFEDYRVLCLTEKPNNILMWAHYADSHKGFVIEFDEGSCFFKDRSFANPYLGKLISVEYAQIRPSIIASEIEDLKCFFVKSQDWSYEVERRIVLPVSCADKNIESGDDIIDLYGFPRSAVKSVILGHKISKKTEERIHLALSSNDEYSSVFVQRAAISERLFEIDISR